MNRYAPLGRIGQQTLREIWDGVARHELESRTRVGDLSLGCELCAFVVDNGDPDSAYLHVFDELPVNSDYPSQLELALSNACNLQCVMCNGDLSSAIRIHREGRDAVRSPYDDTFFAELDDFLPHLERVVLLGGEPLLGAEPLRVAERLIELDLSPACHVTTNGTQWNPRIERIVERLPLHVAVSVDGATADTTESIRVGANHEQVLANVIRFRDATRSTGSDCSIAFSLMRRNARELGAVLMWADSIDVDVFVNDVTYPPQFSLHHMGGTELDALLTDLDREDARISTLLGRNLGRWRSTIENLHRLRQRRVSITGTGAVDTVTTARQIVEVRGGHVLEVMVAASQIVARVDDPDDTALGRSLRTRIGSQVGGLVDPILAELGRTLWTHLDHREDGIELRAAEFVREGVRTRMDVAVATDGAGVQHWFVTVGEP